MTIARKKSPLGGLRGGSTEQDTHHHCHLDKAKVKELGGFFESKNMLDAASWSYDLAE